MKNYYQMNQAESFNADVDALPVAEKLDIQTISGEQISDFKTIKVRMADGSTHFVSCPGSRYSLIQHRDAFMPIKEGCVLAGVHDFRYSMIATPEKASLWLFTGGNGYDGVSIGICVTNSYNSSRALSYGFDMKQYHNQIELVGYRQICSNGMKVRVPLNQAEIIKEEVVTRIRELFKQHAYIRHTKNAESKIVAMQYITEALNLLREPVDRMIKAGQGWSIDTEDKLNFLVKKHVGERFASRILEKYQTEEKTIWGLYNAITFSASHDEDLKATARETLLNHAADLLLEPFQEVKHE